LIWTTKDVLSNEYLSKFVKNFAIIFKNWIKFFKNMYIYLQGNYLVDKSGQKRVKNTFKKWSFITTKNMFENH